MNLFNSKFFLIFRWGLFILSIPFFCIGYFKDYFNIALIGIVMIWICNLIFSMENVRSRIYFLIFNLSQFVFLIANPVISALRGEAWWERFWLFAESFAVLGVYLSTLCLYLGAVIVSLFLNHRDESKKNEKGVIAKFEEKYLQYVQIVALAGLAITWICQMGTGIEKVIFMQGRAYTDFYSQFQSSIPYIFQVAASMMQYFLCIFLATKPNKKWSFAVLSLYILSTIPSLVIGIRNPFVLGCLFAFLYYFFRDALGDTKKWIGRLEKGAMIIAIPVAICLLGAYTYVRSDAEIRPKGIVNIFIDFFVNQGGSFNVLASARGAIPYLPERAGRNYTFGGFIDYITHGTIAQTFFGASPLPDGNNLVNALESNSFAHNYSYIALGETEYLKGNGLGTSYILETYTDYGYAGIIIFSILLGALLIYMMHWAKKNSFTLLITLVALLNIFFIPRAEALGWLQFIIYLQFWIPVIGSVIGGVVLYRLLGMLKGNKNEKV